MYTPWCLESLKKTAMALISTGPHFLGNVNFTVSAEAVESQELCGNEEPVVPEHGRKDTVIKPLLVEVSKPAFSFFFDGSQRVKKNSSESSWSSSFWVRRTK